MRSRKDKDANPKAVADKIWATIDGYDIKDDLYEILSQMRASDFMPRHAGAKRSFNDAHSSQEDQDPEYLD